jgi:hypothetical protein
LGALFAAGRLEGRRVVEEDRGMLSLDMCFPIFNVKGLKLNAGMGIRKIVDREFQHVHMPKS